MNKQQSSDAFIRMNIVNQILDLAEISIEKRQSINDQADKYLSDHFEIQSVSDKKKSAETEEIDKDIIEAYRKKLLEQGFSGAKLWALLNAFKQGLKARTPPTDAIAFADWIGKNCFEYYGGSGEWVRERDNKIAKTTSHLYNLFNPSGTVPQPIGNGMLEAVYEGAAQWEERCNEAEYALKQLVIVKAWKGTNGKDKTYQLMQPMAWDMAIKHLEKHFDEFKGLMPLEELPKGGVEIERMWFPKSKVEQLLWDAVRHFNAINGLPPANKIYFDEWVRTSFNSIPSDAGFDIAANESKIVKDVKPVPITRFNLSSDDLEKLLAECLKPEEIDADGIIQQNRVKELLHWFLRFTDGKSNPKWFHSHAYELAYYIASTGRTISQVAGPVWSHCPDCGGDGKETCHNPDHGFISDIPGEISRLGCPVCGHNPTHKINLGKNKCYTCNGLGKLPERDAIQWAKENNYDQELMLTDAPCGGPVWVKASKRLPKKGIRVMIRREDDHDTFTRSEQSNYPREWNAEGWFYDDTEWLDESGPRVFTREQVSKAYGQGAISAQRRAAGEDFQTETEYMNTNYPEK